LTVTACGAEVKVPSLAVTHSGQLGARSSWPGHGPGRGDGDGPAAVDGEVALGVAADELEAGDAAAVVGITSLDGAHGGPARGVLGDGKRLAGADRQVVVGDGDGDGLGA
jgi:hypothetical protein